MFGKAVVTHRLRAADLDELRVCKIQGAVLTARRMSRQKMGHAELGFGGLRHEGDSYILEFYKQYLAVGTIPACHLLYDLRYLTQAACASSLPSVKQR